MTFARSAARAEAAVPNNNGDTTIMKHLYPLVEVLWLDAETSYGWEEIPDTDLTPVLAVTVGFLVSKNEHYIAVASTYSEGSCNSRIKIPSGMIQSMVEIKPSKTKKSPLESLQSVRSKHHQPSDKPEVREKTDHKPVEIDQ